MLVNVVRYVNMLCNERCSIIVDRDFSSLQYYDLKKKYIYTVELKNEVD